MRKRLVRPKSSYRAAGDQEPIQGGTPRVGSAKCGLSGLMGEGNQKLCSANTTAITKLQRI